MSSDMSDAPIWQPSETRRRAARITAYTDWLAQKKGLRFDSYADLWKWSVSDLDAFWRSVWEYFDLRSPTPYSAVLGKRAMPGSEWFPGARVNYVDQIFRHANAGRPAIVFRDEAGAKQELSWAELERRQTQNMLNLLIYPGACDDQTQIV